MTSLPIHNLQLRPLFHILPSHVKHAQAESGHLQGFFLSHVGSSTVHAGGKGELQFAGRAHAHANGHYYTYFLHVGTYIHCNVGTYMQKVITTPNHHHLPCVDGLGKGYRRVVCVWYDLTYNSDGHP